MSMATPIHATPAGGSATTDVITQKLPLGVAGRWCRVSVARAATPAWWCRVECMDPARGQVVRSQFLPPGTYGGGRITRAGLVHVPGTAESVTVTIFGAKAGETHVAITPLRRLDAAIRLFAFGWRLCWPALQGDPRGRLSRLRAVIGQAPARAGEAPPYALWIHLYESALPSPRPAPGFTPAIAVVGGSDAEYAASVASLREFPEDIALIRIVSPDDWRRIPPGWVIILSGGDRLAAGAAAWFADGAARQPTPALIVADCDTMDAAGGRLSPLLKPHAGIDPHSAPWMLRGACAVRFAAPPAALSVDATKAILQSIAETPGGLIHVPRVLTHCVPNSGRSIIAAPSLHCRAVSAGPPVHAVIPSALRSAAALACISAVAQRTKYDNLRITVAVSDIQSADPKLVRQVAKLPRAEVLELAIRPFNYPAVNNLAVQRGARSEFLLLLNDDVVPQAEDWLGHMVGHMAQPDVGIVGARLLYGNGMVQHEGVIMGLAHLCEHAGRLNPGAAGGVGRYDRDVSAVTAACLLIRSELYAALGGMDEEYAIALNDVDLCLRTREAGFRVVYCAQASALHFESLSLGRHYAGERAARESQEVQRLRARWQAVIDADPTYNPLASLEPGREWQPAFPPRIGKMIGSA